MIKSNREEIGGLYEKRSNAEQAFLERYMAAAEAYERQLDDLRCADAEDYNLLKVRCAVGVGISTASALAVWQSLLPFDMPLHFVLSLRCPDSTAAVLPRLGSAHFDHKSASHL